MLRFNLFSFLLFANGSLQVHAQLLQLCLTLLDPADGLPCPWDSPGKTTVVGCHALLQGTFPTQKSNPHLLHLLHCRQISLTH